MHLEGAGALGCQAGARGGGPCGGLCPRRRCERLSSHPEVGRGRARPQAFAWKAGFIIPLGSDPESQLTSENLIHSDVNLAHFSSVLPTAELALFFAFV